MFKQGNGKDPTPCLYGDEVLLVFFPQMLNSPSGFLIAWWDMPKRKNENPSRLARRMRRMCLQTPNDTYPRQRKAWLMIQLICMWWLITLPQGKTAEHWAYVLNPPLLHPHTWVDEEITVYVNDTISLGLPSSRHINPLSVSYNYTGVSLHEPICFTKQVKENCIQLSPKDNVDDSSRNPGIHWDVE